MERDQAVDNFTNCVMRRGDKDLILKPSLITASMIVPFLLGLLFSCVVLVKYMDKIFDSEYEYYYVVIAVMTSLILIFAMFSFMTFCIARRNRNHLNRDEVWMEALCMFVKEHGGDDSKLTCIRSKVQRRGLKTAARISLVIWLIFIIMVGMVGVKLHFSDLESYGSVIMFVVEVMVFLVVGSILSLIQMVLTVGTVMRLPHNHDSLQAEFTEEFVRQCHGFGFECHPMKATVKTRLVWPHILLMIVTFGLYTLIYFVIVCRDMNKHILMQWEYEEELLSHMIAFVGGTGVEAVEDDEKNRFQKLLRSLV